MAEGAQRVAVAGGYAYVGSEKLSVIGVADCFVDIHLTQITYAFR